MGKQMNKKHGISRVFNMFDGLIRDYIPSLRCQPLLMVAWYVN